MARRLITLMAALLLTAPAGASRITDKRRELGKIQKELERTRAEIEEFRRQEHALGRDLQKMEGRNQEARRRIADIKRHIARAETRKSELKAKAGGLSLAAGFWRTVASAELAEHARHAAASQPASSRSLWGESFRRAAVLEKATLLASLQGASRSTLLAEAEARRAAQELADKSRRAKAEELSALKRLEEQKTAIASTQEKAAAAERRAKELEQTAAELNSLLDRLTKAGSYKPKPGKAKLEVPRRSLPWPVEGTVARPFGREKNPELGTWVIRQGALFATRAEAPVAAVASGRVIYAGAFRSYGQVVIVDHGSSFFSVYGTLGAILKAKGDVVEAGQVLAKAGPAEDGGSLYLELRRGTEALDPLDWLKETRQ